MTGDARGAFAAEVARLRADAGLSLAELACAAHNSRGYLHHVERARWWPSRSVVAALDAALAAGGALLVVWERGGQERRRVRHTHYRAGALPPLIGAGGLAGPPVVDVVAMRTMVQALQAADRQVGGGRLYPMVLRYLHAEVVPALVDARADADSGELFAAAAAVTDIAGWMAHECATRRCCVRMEVRDRPFFVVVAAK